MMAVPVLQYWHRRKAPTPSRVGVMNIILLEEKEKGPWQLILERVLATYNIIIDESSVQLRHQIMLIF